MPTPLAGGDTSSYGFGLTIDRYRGARIVGHGGADAARPAAAFGVARPGDDRVADEDESIC